MKTATTTASKSTKSANKGKGKKAQEAVSAEAGGVATLVAPPAPAAPAAPLQNAAPAIPAVVAKRVTIEDVESGPMEVKATITTGKDLRGESKRGLLLTALKSEAGITMSTACTKFEWKPRDFADALRLLAKVNGVTTFRDEAGHWRVKTA